MTANSILFDFNVESQINQSERNNIIEIILSEFKNIFNQIRILSSNQIGQSHFCILVADDENYVITVRIYENKGLITLNVEYYLEENEKCKLDFDSIKLIETNLSIKTNSKKSKYLPPIKRGEPFIIYMTTSDDRLIEYDSDKLVFEKRTEFQKIQIVHSKTMGNMLILDELQNIADVDLIYTETLMQRGIEHYKGKEICILGGGDGALLYELLKEKPKYVVMIEIDEIVMQACNKYMNSICGDVLEKRKGENYEIIVGDCLEYMKKYIDEKKKFDYVFGDLTDIPISDTPTGEIWNFIRTILEHSFKILKQNGKFLTHGNGTSCPESLQMYEDQISALNPPVKFTKSTAFVPSFMEEWVFYQVSHA